MNATRKKSPAGVPTLKVVAQAHDTAAEAVAATRTEVRRAVAEWLSRTHAALMDIAHTAERLQDEVDKNPEGEVARALAGNVNNLHDLAIDASQLDANLCSVYMTPDHPLPDPVSLARG